MVELNIAKGIRKIWFLTVIFVKTDHPAKKKSETNMSS
jgi:hypothetical protein